MKTDKSRLLTNEEICFQTEYIFEHNPGLPLEVLLTAIINTFCISQDKKTASILRAEFAQEKELLFNPDWKPDLQVIIKEHNEAIAGIETECLARVEKLFEEIEVILLNELNQNLNLYRWWQDRKKREGIDEKKT